MIINPAFLTLGLIAMMIVALYKEWTKPVYIFAATTGILTLFEVINPDELLSGFANEQIAVIMLLLVVSYFIQKAGVMESWLNVIFKGANNYSKFSFRLMSLVALVSAFLNNTPIVATFIPYVFSWGKKNGIAPSKFLIPLSYTAIIGGTITLIGTSTNLVVNGLAKQYGLPGFELFDFIYAGLPLTVLGILYMWLFGNKLLPSNIDALDEFNSNSREYLVETLVLPNSPLVDKQVQDADLRNLKGLFLVEIIRGDRKIVPVKPTQNIRPGDYLIFAGDTHTIPDLINSNLGLQLPKLRDIPNQESIDVVEAVISYNSSLINKMVRETDFRGVYDAAIVAIHRNGEKLLGKIGDIVLETGDLLVLLTGKDFKKRSDNSAFYLLNTVKQINTVDRRKGIILTLGAVLAIVLSALKFITLFKALVIYIFIVLLLRWVKSADIQKGFDSNLAIIAALSIALGQAMTKSGAANMIADGVIDLSSSFGALGALIGIYLLTNLLTEFITNVAAATIAFPIAFSMAQHMGIAPEPFILAIAYAASASFLSPMGYQTNLMVYGPGGYRFKDYIRFGFPMSIVAFITVILVLGIRYDFF